MQFHCWIKFSNIYFLLLLCHFLSKVLSGIVSDLEGLGKHLDDPIPNGDFPELHSLGIVSLVSDIMSDNLRKYHLKIHKNKILIPMLE